MIVKAMVKPWDVECQRSDFTYSRVEDMHYYWNVHIGPLEKQYPEYRSVGPTMLTEWEKEE